MQQLEVNKMRAENESVVAAVSASSAPKVEHCPTCGEPMIWVPVLKCAHCGRDVPLRAFVYSPRDGQFIAECIDLDLLSQGNSKEEAIEGLQEAMHGYLDVAFDGGCTRGLVLRPSPISRRIRYHLHRIRDFFNWGFRSRYGKHLFAPRAEIKERPCHL